MNEPPFLVFSQFGLPVSSSVSTYPSTSRHRCGGGGGGGGGDNDASY